MLLQMPDDGYLTDGHGRTVDFKNNLLILTSNIGGTKIHERVQQLEPDDAAEYTQLETEVMADKRITLTLTPDARELLAKSGFDPAYGARPLKRAIQRLVVDRLAEALLDGTIQEGQSVVGDLDPELPERISFSAE